MVRIITIENPFEPRVHDVFEMVYTGQSIDSYIELFGRDIYLNGQPVDTITIPADGDEIISMPHVSGGGVGKVLGFVAMVALTVVTSGISSNGLTGFLGLTIKGGTLASCLMAGAVMYLGGRVINSVFPQQAATLDSQTFKDTQVSQTYGWNLPTVSTREGRIVGETYGTCIPQPQLLEEHVETIGGKQYLNLLYCGGYGEVDRLTNLKIDSTPIDCFSNVQVEKRLGTNDQEPISFFDNTPTDQSVGLLLDLNKPLIRTTDSTKASAIEVALEWPNGLYHLNNDGVYEGASIVCRIDYRKTGTKDWLYQNSYTVSNSSPEAFRKSFKWNVGAAGQYDVKLVLTTKPSGSRYMSYTSWSILTAYNSGRYARPNKVLIGLRILATNQLSGGIPNLTWKQTRSKVYVFNPRLNCYEIKSANNPIWAAYDILHGCRYLKNINTDSFEYIVDGCAHERLDSYFDQWQSAAAYADEEIINHDGEKEKRFEFDAFFDTAQKRYDAAVKAAAVGHANIIIHGCNYGITVDRPGMITQVFSEGRTSKSSVNGSFLSRLERARSIEITYNDENNDFKNTQFTLRNNQYELDAQQDNTAQLTLFGVKRRSQAYREGVMALAASERQLQTIELFTDINGITAEYGDIVGYAHSVSKIGLASGRIVSATKNTVKLDKTVSMENGKNYEIYIQTSMDELIHKAVKTEPGNTDTLTLMSAMEYILEQYDCYSFGEAEKAVKPFRIVGAERDGDFLVKLRLIEYDEAVYSTELEYSKYPKIDYTAEDNLTAANVTAVEYTYVEKDGTVLSAIDVVWEGQSVYGDTDGYSVLVTNMDDESSEEFIVNGLDYRYTGAKVGSTYKVLVRPIVRGNRINGTTVFVTITGKNTPPADLSFMSLVLNEDMIIAVIKPVAEPDLDHYEIRMGSSWDNSVAITEFAGTQATFRASTNGTCTYLVKAVDTSGNKSENACKQIINITNLVAANILFEKNYGVGDFTSWNNLYEHNRALKMLDKRNITDFEYFRDIFGQISYLNGCVYLPLIDLGENIIDSDCYYIDSKGVIHQQDLKRIRDYENFGDIFAGANELTAPISLASTFLGIKVDGAGGDDVIKEIYYRTSIDGYTFSDWLPAAQTVFKGRFLQIRVDVKSISGHTQGTIKNVSVSIDVPDTEIILENILLSAGENYIAFNHRFMTVPSSVAVFTSDLEGRAVTWQITDCDERGCKLCVYDDKGELCEGKLVRAMVRGY
ncbi:MAG: phage tail protein [Lachnospiraceae bacterium]|nr:phage tail protein [Lachnospiraceae bacterium]